MKFEIGEKIICINDGGFIKPNSIGITNYNEYIVLKTSHPRIDMVHILNDRGEIQDYQINRFISLEQFRLFKIDKIQEKWKKNSSIG